MATSARQRRTRLLRVLTIVFTLVFTLGALGFTVDAHGIHLLALCHPAVVDALFGLALLTGFHTRKG